MDYYMPLEISKPVHFAGSTFGLGLVGSSKYANLNAPIGYYFGYNWSLFKGASELSFKIPDAFLAYKYASVPTNYDIKYSILELINTLEIGKEYYLDHHLTIGGGIQFGYALHIETKTSNTYNNLIYNNNDIAIIDNSFPLYPYHSPEFIENIYGEYVNLGFIRFFVTPKLRIGYLF
jgi:hypothetical protein